MGSTLLIKTIALCNALNKSQNLLCLLVLPQSFEPSFHICLIISHARCCKVKSDPWGKAHKQNKTKSKSHP